MTRDTEWWPRLDAAFQGALEQPLSERTAYLDRVCDADRALRTEVEAMLAADAPPHAFDLERLVRDDLPPDIDPLIGMELGVWRVVGLVAHGGMATVYEAVRIDGRYEQRVALKLLRGPAAQPGTATRFRAETHILARLSHPNIARLLDAGLTPEGSAYLVIEYVEGSPVTAYCEARRLTVDQRLRLFRIVCEATQHAHQSLVVHRDLKPSNIFVSGSGEVKLLDFGIAKLLEPDHPLAMQTAPELRALTPAYAAPEQLRGEPVTTAADVYVLGAVLYELLTGQRPLGNGTDVAAPRGQLEMPPAPSVAVRRRLRSTDADPMDASSRVAAARGTTPKRLARLLEGDIDRVVLKALQVEPERRYTSAGQLADDLGRILDGRPVMAQADTVTYRARRFIGRHRVGVVMTAVVCALVVSFAVVAGLQARAVAMERDRARLQAVRANRVSVLVTDLFKLAEPAAGRGDSITTRELLDQGTRRITVELQGDPETQAALFNAVARVYGNLGLHDAAIAVLRQALDLEHGSQRGGTLVEADTRHLLGERHAAKNDYPAAIEHFRAALALQRLHATEVEMAATLHAMGRTLGYNGHFDEGRTLLEEAVAIRRRMPGASAGELMSGLHELGMLLHRSGEVGRAETLFREAVDVGRTISGSSPAKVTSLRRLAEVVAEFDNEPARAQPLLREALTMARTIYPADHQEIAWCLGELARNHLSLRQLTDGETVAREYVAMVQRLYGDRNDETLIAWRTLAGVLRARRRFDEAERLLRQALAQSRSLFGDGRPITITTSRSLASVLEEQDRFDEALVLREEELGRTIGELGEHDVFVAIGLTGLGQHGLARGRPDLAEAYFTRALAVRVKIHPADHWRIDEARALVGVARLRAGRFVDAERDLLAAYDGLRAHRGPTAEETAAARARLVELYQRWNRPDRAAQYRAMSNFP